MTNRVIIGSIYIERGYSHQAGGMVWNSWGDTHLRRGEFRAVPGCKERPHGWGFELPISTAQATINALSAPVCASPISEAIAWTKSPQPQPRYSGLTKRGETVVITLWDADALSIVVKNMTLARIAYDVEIEAHSDPQTGDWTLKDRYSKRAERSFNGDKDDLTTAARREAWRVIGGWLAGFLENTPLALIYGRDHALAQQRATIQSELASLQAKLDSKRAELAAVPADEPLDATELETQTEGGV